MCWCHTCRLGPTCKEFLDDLPLSFHSDLCVKNILHIGTIKHVKKNLYVPFYKWVQVGNCNRSGNQLHKYIFIWIRWQIVNVTNTKQLLDVWLLCVTHWHAQTVSRKEIYPSLLWKSMKLAEKRSYLSVYELHLLFITILQVNMNEWNTL